MYLERVTSTAVEPTKATQDSACYDVCADIQCRPVSAYPDGGSAVGDANSILLQPGERALIPTGWKMCCDQGFRIAMYPRSGLAIKQGIALANCVGVVDADYRNEVMIPVVNTSNMIVTIRHGERIAQIALERLEPTEIKFGTLPETNSDRSGGFGSTGK